MSPERRDEDGTLGHEESDRHRRRVLWALPTGLYLVGSRAGDAVNLMTANLVVQVCVEPPLVGVAVERGSVTARLVGEGGAFSISLLRRQDRIVVRRFVKPVTDVSTAADGSLATMSGHAVVEVGPDRLPVLADAAGFVACQVSQVLELGSHLWCIGQVVDVGGEPGDILRMEDTRMHYGG